MIDLAQCHWVVDTDNQLYLASAPSMRAPFRFDCFTKTHQPSRRLSAEEAELLNQAAIESGSRPMTFVCSDEGIQFIQSFFAEEVIQARVA